MKKNIFITIFVLSIALWLPKTSLAAGATTSTDSGLGQLLVVSDSGATFLTTELNQTGNNPDDVLIPKGYAKSLPVLMTSLLSILVALLAIVVFFYLVWGGVSWITSGGDKGKTETARGRIVAAVVGLIIVISSYAILQIILRFLGFGSITDIFNHVIPINSGKIIYL